MIFQPYFRCGVALLFCLLLLGVAGIPFCFAQVQVKTLSGRLLEGDFVLDAREGAGWRLDSAAGLRQDIDVDVVPVEGGGFPTAVFARTHKQPNTTHALQLQMVNAIPVRKGDLMLARFFARGAKESAEDMSEAETAFLFESYGGSWTKSVLHQVLVTDDWQEFVIPFVSAGDYAPGKARALFRLGFSPQWVEIGGFELINLGNQTTLNDLPRTSMRYFGYEADAPWRKEAEERIQKHRMADIVVRITDNEGRPLPGVEVHVAMRRHAFAFGSAVNTGGFYHLLSAEYRRIIEDAFNRVTFEWEMKWPHWERSAYDRRPLMEMLDWLHERDIAVRGHTMIWPGWRNVPEDLQTLASDPEALRVRIDNHISAIGAALSEQVTEWDVVNEPLLVDDLLQILGRDELIRWFKLAHENDPHARLFLNEANMPNASAKDPVYDRFAELIEFLLAQGAPLHGLGMQGHFSAPQPPERLLGIFDRFAKYNLPILITEFDYATTDEELQAAYLRDFLTVCFSHPAVEGLLLWGFWDRYHWRKDAALWREDWSIKPAGEMWMHLVREAWWTDVIASTDTSGEVSVNGFLGDYTVTVRSGDHSMSRDTKLEHQGQMLTFVIPSAHE